MPMSSYGVSVIPDAHKAAYNLICAAYYGDPPSSQNLSRPLIPASSPNPALAVPTHWMGGLPVGSAWVAAFGTGAPLPTPPGGWPYMVDGIVLLTEAAAEIAWSARYVNVNVGANAEDLPSLNVDTVLAALGLAEPPPPEL